MNGFLPIILLHITLPFILVFSSYVYIRTYVLVRRIQQRIGSLSVPTEGNNGRDAAVEQSKQRKITRMTSFMCISLFVCYLPRVSIFPVWRYEINTYGDSKPFTDTIGIVAHLLGSIRSLINPIIYYHSMEVLRKTIRNIFSFRRKERESEHRSVSVQISTISTF